MATMIYLTTCDVDAELPRPRSKLLAGSKRVLVNADQIVYVEPINATQPRAAAKALVVLTSEQITLSVMEHPADVDAQVEAAIRRDADLRDRHD